MNRWTMVSIFVLGSLTWSAPSFARVFSFEKENLASYFRGSGGLSRVSSDAFSRSSGSDTKFSDEVSYGFGGEVGVMLSVKSLMSLRLGIELLQPNPLKEIKGKDAVGTELMSLTSRIFVVNPMATVDIYFFKHPTYRGFFFVGAGLAKVTLKNEYAFTAASTYGVTDYTEKSEASLISAHTGVGIETLFVDNVTAAIEMGYRHMPVSDLKYSSDVTTISGPRTQGASLVNDDGNKRTLDLSSWFIGFSCRFYIDFT